MKCFVLSEHCHIGCYCNYYLYYYYSWYYYACYKRSGTPFLSYTRQVPRPPPFHTPVLKISNSNFPTTGNLASVFITHPLLKCDLPRLETKKRGSRALLSGNGNSIVLKECVLVESAILGFVFYCLIYF